MPFPRIISLGLIICITISCNNQKSTIKFNKFPKEFNLKGEIVETKEKYKGGFLEQIDSILILTNTVENKYQFHLYNKYTFDFLGHGGLKGRGPHELTNPLYAVLDKNQECIWIPDHAKKRIVKYEIDSVLNNSNYLSKTAITFPEDLFIIYYTTMEKQLFALSSFSQDTLLVFLNHEGNIVDSMTIENKINLYNWDELPVNHLLSYYTFTINQQMNKIAFAYYYSDHLIVIDFNGNIISKSFGPNKIYQQPDQANPDRKLTNQIVKSDEKLILCLYNGKRKYDKETNMLPSYGRNIHIYDWNGIPIANLELQFDAMSFTIDAESKRIITFSPEANTFVYYDFNIGSLYE